MFLRLSITMPFVFRTEKVFLQILLHRPVISNAPPIKSMLIPRAYGMSFDGGRGLD
jgi:hypothetical protein